MGGIQMKSIFKTLSIFLFILIGILSINIKTFAQKIEINETNFPDAAIRNALNEYWNIYYGITGIPMEPGYIETNDITRLSILSKHGVVTSVEGIDLFTNLQHLDINNFSGNTISLNNNFNGADIISGVYIRESTTENLNINLPNATCNLRVESKGTKNILINAPNISYFYLYGNNYISTISGYESLFNISEIHIEDVTFTSLNLSNCKNLQNIFIDSTKINSIQGLNNLTELNTFWACHNELKKIDLSSNKNLKDITCVENQITSLKIPSSIESLSCGNNKLKTIDLSKCTNLEFLDASDNNINGKKLNLSKNKKLTTLYLNDNRRLNSINISKNTKLKNLDVSKTNIKKLNLKNNNKLNRICFYNSKIKKLDLTSYKKLSILYDTKKGKTIKLKDYLGTGYKCIKKNKSIKYNNNDNSLTIIGKGNSEGEASITLKKDGKTYHIILQIN